MKIKEVLHSFTHAIDGIVTAIKTERNFKVHTFCSCLVLLFGIVLKINKWEWLICIGWIAAVTSAELLNTAIEIAIDLTMPDYHVLAKKSKDIAAGAVLLVAIGAAISAAIIFLPKLIVLIQSWF